jgi:hypothetical protein
LLARRPTPKLEDHPLSAVRNCLFDVFTATLHKWRPFLRSQPEDAPCRGDRDPLNTISAPPPVPSQKCRQAGGQRDRCDTCYWHILLLRKRLNFVFATHNTVPLHQLALTLKLNSRFTLCEYSSDKDQRFVSHHHGNWIPCLHLAQAFHYTALLLTLNPRACADKVSALQIKIVSIHSELSNSLFL